jgi:transcriptional regulator with XRE-family HTH domain
MEERLQSLMGYLGLTGGKFAETIGVQKSSISHILSGRNKPSFEFISRILSTYREISPEWLILGEGEMLKRSESVSHKDESMASDDLFRQTHEDSKDHKDHKEKNNPQNNNKFTNVNTTKRVEKIIFVYDDRSFDILHENNSAE